MTTSAPGSASTTPHRSFKSAIAKVRVTPVSFGVSFATLIILTLLVVHFTHYQQLVEANRLTWWLIVIAAAAGYLQYLGYAISLTGATDKRMSFPRTFELEVAESTTTMLTPESMGNIAMTMPFLEKQGLAGPEAAAATGLSSMGTTLVAAVVLPVAAIFAVSSLNVAALKKDVPTGQWEILAGILAVAVIVTLLVKIPKLRSIVASWLKKGADYARTVAEHPAKGALIGLGELVTIFGNVAVLTLLVLAVNQHIHLAAFTVIVLLAGTASNIVPIPGGLGAPEAILIAGLSSVGVGHSESLVIALSYRLFTYWLPTIPGALCFYDLHRRDLV